MKIVKVIGGLGNQMFQYAFYLALKYCCNEEIKLDVSAFPSYSLHNSFELHRIFNITYNAASIADRLRLSYQGEEFFVKVLRKIFKKRKTEYTEPCLRYDSKIFACKRDVYYIGYWQSYKYFTQIEDQARDTFTFPEMVTKKNIALEQIIKNVVSVSIHVRRGDYVDHPLYRDICTLDYYNSAIEYLKSRLINPVFFIFSNDPEWCKNNLNLSDNYYLIDWNMGKDSFRDMQLMSYCKHNIIANSSFSWWGSWLNQHVDKIVVAPSKWLNDERVMIEDILPPCWVLLP